MISLLVNRTIDDKNWDEVTRAMMAEFGKKAIPALHVAPIARTSTSPEPSTEHGMTLRTIQVRPSASSLSSSTAPRCMPSSYSPIRSLQQPLLQTSHFALMECLPVVIHAGLTALPTSSRSEREVDLEVAAQVHAEMKIPQAVLHRVPSVEEHRLAMGSG